MILRRLFDEKLAQASYLVACDHARVALVVDPNRNISQYLDAAAADKVRIVAVTETHIHADFVSGSRELAAATGAQLYLSGVGGADWQYRYANSAGAEILTDGYTFNVGDVRIEAVHTPGHTPEHMTFLVTDTAVGDEPMGALTGDFIFVGDVGRPDLLERAAGFAGTMEAGARQLFKSLREFKKRPDYLQIWPGHGAGSACGKALGAMPQSTLGYEKLFNWALAEDDEARFVSEVLSGQPEPPAYFARMKQVNRDGPGDVSVTTPPLLDAAAVRRATKALVDTRSAQDYANGHIRNSINVPRNKSFLNWAGSLLPYDSDLVFIGASLEDDRTSLARDLALIGLERIAGVFPAESIDELVADGDSLISTKQTSIRDNPGKSATILDVRSRTEFAEGHIPNGVNIPLGELPGRLAEVPRGEVVVHCQGGSRSLIAASILQQAGRDDVSNLVGGFAEWERSGRPVERGNGAG
ncbi:MAG TPA: MBL fold metallo-hydrolase [Gemmatimonadaceae bacterium]